MFSQARFLPAAKKSGRNNEVTVRRGFTVICILKQDIPQKNLQIRRSLFASYGTPTMNYLASLGILMRQGHRAQR